MYVSRLPKFSLFMLAFGSVLDYASLNPVGDIPTDSELGDLNKIQNRSKPKLEETESSSFTHYDEDSLRLVADLNEGQKLKYDVEVLEVQDTNRESLELEERFRGPAIKMDTDNFVAENIEVNGGSAADNEKAYREETKDGEGDVEDDDDDDEDDDNDDDDAVKPSHMILTMVLVFVALFSVALYVALVIWRSNLERRYGMRELLVTHDDDFYLPSSETTDRRW